MELEQDWRLDPVESVEDYARLVARIRQAASQDRALSDSDVTPEEFEQARAWHARIADQIANGEMSLAAAFAAAFATESAASAPSGPSAPSEVAAPPSRRSVLGASNAAAAEPIRFDSGAPPSRVAATEQGSFEATLEGALAAARPVLPFDENATPSLEAASARQPRSSTDDDLALDSTRSIEMPMPAGGALPFGPPTPPMPIEHFASLTATLRAFPEKREVILGRYGLCGEADLAALIAAFDRVFAADPATKAAFARRIEELAARLAKPKE